MATASTLDTPAWIDAALLRAALAEHDVAGEELATRLDAEESRLWAVLVDDLADDLWQDHRAAPSLLGRIRQATGGRMIRPSAPDVAQEYRDTIPSHYRRMQGGVAADSVATELGFAEERELFAAMEAEAGRLLQGHADARRRAELMVYGLSEWRAWEAERTARWDAWQAERDALALALADAEAAEAIDARLRRLPLAPVVPFPVPAVPTPARVAATALPSRRGRPRSTPPLWYLAATAGGAWAWALLLAVATATGRLMHRWARQTAGAILSWLAKAATPCGGHVTRRAKATCRHCRPGLAGLVNGLIFWHALARQTNGGVRWPPATFAAS